ncbi:MAG: SurA N-terminal domain-containing protein [Spirochaetia bacterium]|nr:SurA N-terminal domain-containing protein [Spirochaetia bacterium]
MKKILLSVLMLLATAGMAFAQADLQPLVVVKLNKNESVTVKQLKTRVKTYEKQMGQTLSADDRKKILDTIIDEKLMLQAAAKAGVNIPDSAVDQYFLQWMSQQVGQNLSEKELNDLIKKTQGVTLDEFLTAQVGMSVAEYKAYLKNQLIIQQYVVQSKQSEMQKVTATDDEIRMFYESNKASFVMNDTIKAFLILVPKGNDADAAKNKANELRNKYVDKKMTVDQIVVQANIEGSGYQAGETLIPKTEVAAQAYGLNYPKLVELFQKEEGYVTEAAETPTDFRVLALEKKYTAKMLSLSDSVQPESTYTVYQYINQNLTQQKQMAYLQTAAQELAASFNTPANVEWKKSGDDLTKLLSWSN